MRRIAALLLLMAVPAFAGGLELHKARSSPQDLAVTGALVGFGPGETRYVTWADLNTLPKTKLSLTGEFVPGEQEVTAVFLSDLLKALPLKPGADTVLGTCTDGYASVFRKDFIDRYRPFVVLEIAGLPPTKWPPPGLDYNPGPYVITVSEKLVPEAAGFLDIAHKKPWGVATLKVVNFDESFAPAYSGAWASLSSRAQQGRDIWINSCLCCHEGPKGLYAGAKADRPFPVLQAWARCDPEYFKRYVRNPQDEATCAKMEAHPQYSEAQLEAVLAFVLAETRS